MKSSIGKMFHMTIFGESHGEMIGVSIDGLPAGIKLDLAYMNAQLDLRKPKGKISTSRKESDAPHIISGYFNEHTTGTPLTILFENNNTKSKDYSETKNVMRPSHADYTANEKYMGYQDYRGGGHFSGRLTTPIVAAGAIAKQILASKGIQIGSHIRNIASIYDEAFDDETLLQQIDLLNNKYFPVLSEKTEAEMMTYMEQVASEGDSCGGVIETLVAGMPVGIGEPMFHSIESTLSQLLFSVPAIKGVEFGLGFEFMNHKGSELNDSFYYEGTSVKTKTNHNGGINGGISNGMPIRIKSVVKPTPSIFKHQDSINIETKENVNFQINGRHDPAIIHRARVVIDSVVAIGLLDLCAMRYGYLWMKEDK